MKQSMSQEPRMSLKVHVEMPSYYQTERVVLLPDLSVSVECGVSQLVYTSTFNVVFGGQEIRNGDESLPYLPLDKVVMDSSVLVVAKISCGLN